MPNATNKNTIVRCLLVIYTHFPPHQYRTHNHETKIRKDLTNTVMSS